MSVKSVLSDIAGWFQPNYDKIAAWKLSAEQKDLLDDIYDKLPASITKALGSLVVLLGSKYGVDAAKKFLAKVLGPLNDML